MISLLIAAMQGHQGTPGQVTMHTHCNENLEKPVAFGLREKARVPGARQQYYQRSVYSR